MFDKTNIKKVAGESNFIQRTRKISAVSLLESVLFTGEDPSKTSLNDMAIYHFAHYGVSLSRQAIAKKFNKQATAFLKLLLSQVLRSRLSYGFRGFSNTVFSRVIIKDSTCNQLPDNLKAKYPGSGGSGSGAAVRIQFEYDLKNLEILDLAIVPFNDQDIANAKETLGRIEKDDLVIRDLGYISIDILKGIEKQNAWYISRLNYATTVVDKDTLEVFDFSEIESYMRGNDIEIIDKYVLIGKEKYPTRLVIELLPDKVKEERIRKAAYISKKKGRKMSKEKKTRAGLNLYITNCSPSLLSSPELRRVYGIRWQIELVFKAWKQNSQFHKIKKMNSDRYEFLIYAKLIWSVLNWKIYQVLDIMTFRNIRQRISILKLFKTLKAMKGYVIKILKGDRTALDDIMECLSNISRSHLLHDDRKDRINWRIVENI